MDNSNSLDINISNSNTNKETKDRKINVGGKKKYELLGIPGQIRIGKYNYVYKDQSKVDKNLFTYRCQNWNCKILININRENLNKIKDKDKNKNIEYKQKKEHKCTIIENKNENTDNCSTDNEMIQKAEKLIKLNPLKPLSYHLIKLEENHILLDKKKINLLINKIKNSIYPKDTEFIQYINQIQITFDDNIDKAKNLNFCPIYTRFINPLKKNREEKFIIFTSIFHLKFLSDSNQIFVDATFKSSPNNFYQLLNIMAYNKNNNFFMPIAFILMSNKSLTSYEKIFDEIIFLLKVYKININFKNIRFLCDFEKSLLKAIRNKFNGSKINGCYFHFVKSLWKKMRNLGFTKKKSLNNTKIIIFACKLFPFILKENKNKYINELYDYANKIDCNYSKFIKYFHKNWEYSDFLNFDQLNNGEIMNRTNNIIESFHHRLNSIIEYAHPRISILIEKLKFISIEYYKSYVSKFFEENNNSQNKQNIYMDMYNFLEKFMKKYNKNININILTQDEGETKNLLDNICNKILSELYNIKFEDNKIDSNVDEEEELEVKDAINSNTDNSSNDLEENWWRDILMEQINSNNKNDDINDENINPFEIDNNFILKKRNHYLIENDILKYLYEKEDNIGFKYKKTLKK